MTNTLDSVHKSEGRTPPPTPDEVRDLVEKTPRSGRRVPVALLAFVATLGSLLFGYDTGVISGALPYMLMPDAAGGMHLSSVQEGLVTGLLSLGAMVGAMFGGRLSDRYGRRHNIILLAIIFNFSTLGCVFAPNVGILFLFRFLLGCAVGGASATVPVYLAETAPQHLRGPLVAVDQFLIVTGQLVAYSMNAVLAHYAGGPSAVVDHDPTGKFPHGSTQSWDTLQSIANLTVMSGNGQTWRHMLVLATIPAVLLWIFMHFMPESSRWYAARSRYYEAIGALKRVRKDDDPTVTQEIDGMVDLHRVEAEDEQWSLRTVMRTPWTRRLLIIGSAVGVLDQLTGINTAMYYLPIILTAAGFSSASAITLNVVTGIFSFIGSAFGFLFVGKLMRRHVGMYQTSGVAVCLLSLAGVFFFGINKYAGADGAISGSIPAVLPWAVLIIISVFLFIKQSGTIQWIYVSEIFPAKIRGVAQGFAVGIQWLGNFVIAFTFPILMDHIGGGWTYLILGIINIGSLIFYIKIVPETKTRTLEELEERFRNKYGTGDATAQSVTAGHEK